MPPPDPPQKPKPTPPQAALDAMAAREAAAKAKAAAGIKPPAMRAAPPPPAPVVPARPGQVVGLRGFGVWFVALVAALSLLWNVTVRDSFRPYVLHRKILGGSLAAILLVAIWFTQAIEKDARIVRLVWVIAVATLVIVPAFFLFNRFG